jgi:uncharacterized protein
MEFLLIGRDDRDARAAERRASARAEHLKLADEMKANGQLLFAAALLDEHDQMVGSVMIVRFDSRDGVNEWLRREPYVLGEVWRDIAIEPCKPGPSFLPNG